MSVLLWGRFVLLAALAAVAAGALWTAARAPR
jgi:hypothetical protein